MSKTFELYRTAPSDVELERGRFAGEEDSYLDEVPGRRDDEEEGDDEDIIIPPMQTLEEKKDDDDEDEEGDGDTV